MAIESRVAGAALIRIASPSTASLVDLGYTRNGVQLTDQGYYVDVPGDRNGGDDGPPIDIQYIGQIAVLRFELTEWDETVADLLRQRVPGATVGVPSTPGQLLFSGNKALRVLVLPSTGVQNFPRALCQGALEINKGTKFSSLIGQFTCYRDASGVLWNTVTTSS